MAVADVRCVVFDLDDTLWPQKLNLDAAWDAMCLELAKLCPETDFGISDQDSFRTHMKTTMGENPDHKHDFTFVRKKTLERLTGDVKLAADSMAAWLQKRNNPQLFSGALETVKALRNSGMQIGTLTDGNADAACVNGLKDFLGFCVSSIEVGASKPDRRMFASCENRSGCSPEQLVMVGDNLEKDIMGAKAAGWRTIWIRPPKDGSGAVGGPTDLLGSKVVQAEEGEAIADASVDSVVEVEGVISSWTFGKEGNPERAALSVGSGGKKRNADGDIVTSNHGV